MADRSSQLMLAALSRASADAGLPLYGSKTSPGLFPSTALGKQAAQRCCDEGYLEAVAGNTSAGRSRNQVCALTDKGRAFLFSQLSPRQVLEDFVRVLEAREAQVGQLQTQVRQLQASLEALRNSVAGVLEQVCQGDASTPVANAPASPNLNGLCAQFHQAETGPTAAIVEALTQWVAVGIGGLEDCPLPELFRQVRASCPGVSLGAFHDALRRLQADDRIYLHPWTGPLYAIPEPPCALLVGHVIAYYASLRQADL
jgi:hypothetical protein